MSKSLLVAMAHGDEDVLALPDAAEPNPAAVLRLRALRTFARDIAALGLGPTLAQRVAVAVVQALGLALDDSAVSPMDQAAALLVAERAMVAALAAVLTAMDEERAAPPQAD